MIIVWLIENNRLSSKQRMYEVYLNIIEWAPNVYGIGEASRFYFNKLPSQLNLGESIFLASIVPKPKKFKYSIHVQKQVEHGLELIVGVKYDQSFGNVLMFGAGGILAELIGDSNLAILPLDKDRALKLVGNSSAYKLLKGYRGHKPYAIEKLVDLLIKLGSVAQASNYFSEITINPIIVTEKEAWAVDPRILLK